MRGLRALFQGGVWQRIIIGTERNSASVMMVGDLSALYYPEKETGDSTRPAQRVVAIEDLWDTLVGVHNQLSLQEPASIGAELGGSFSSFTYDQVPESEYTSSIGMSSQQPPLEEPPILSPLLPSSSLPAETDDNSYDILYRHSLVANSHLTSIWLQEPPTR